MAKKKAEVVVPKDFTSSFKLPSAVKCVMATIADKHARGAYKRAMIAAELTYLANKKKQPSRADLSKDE